MRLTDLTDLPAGASVTADVCIVGSGPAGLTLARELDGTGLTVVLVESGGADEDQDAVTSLDRIVSVGASRVMEPELLRFRGLGGASAIWGGRIARFSEADLRPRAWVPNSGWPVTLAELEPYYARAAQHLNLALTDANHPDVLDAVAGSIPPPAGDALEPFVWGFSMNPSVPPDFLRLRPRADLISDDVECLLHATVTHIDTDEAGGIVERVEITGPDLGRRWIVARQVVLAAGGLENARLLLASNRILEAGLGNAHDVVGRFLMDHPRGEVARFPADARAAADRLLGDFVIRSSQLPPAARTPGPGRTAWLTPGYALGVGVQEREELLGCALFLTPEPAEDDPLTVAMAVAQRTDLLRNAGSLLSQRSLAFESVKRLRSGRYPARSLAGLYAQCIVEQRPDRESRLTLSGELDALGVPIARVDWRISEQEARTVRRASELFIAEAVRLGLPAPVPTAMIADPHAEFHLPDVAHPSGTTRMSDDPRDGVVDADCAVHGMENLHVVGGSVFPTNGHVNPTYTIVALAVRLADRIKIRLRPRSSTAPLPDVAAELGRNDATGAARLRIGITGALGFVGAEITGALREAGHEVVALTRRPEPGFAHRSYDLSTPLDAGLLDGIDVVIHCAYSWEPSAWEDIVRVNVEGTRRLVDLSNAVGARFILISSVSAFVGTRQRYGSAKLLAEETTLQSGGTVVRLGMVYGGSNNGVFGLLQRLAGLPLVPIFAPRSPQAMISVENLRAAVVALIDNPPSPGQVIGLASPATVPFGDLMRSLASAGGRRPLVVPIPWRALFRLLSGIERLGLPAPLSPETILGIAEPMPGTTDIEIWRRLGVEIDEPDLEPSPPAS